MISTSETVRNVPLAIIESNCQDLAQLRGTLRKKHEAKQKEQMLLDAKYNPELRAIQDKCNEARAALIANLTGGRALFNKPKTRVFHGITVGFEKEQDKLILPEEPVLVKRVEQMLPAKQAETVLDRTVTIIKSAFKKLPWADLQRLGCSRVSGADKPVVRANDDDIETLVQKSIGEVAK